MTEGDEAACAICCEDAGGLREGEYAAFRGAEAGGGRGREGGEDGVAEDDFGGRGGWAEGGGL